MVDAESRPVSGFGRFELFDQVGIGHMMGAWVLRKKRMDGAGRLSG